MLQARQLTIFFAAAFILPFANTSALNTNGVLRIGDEKIHNANKTVVVRDRRGIDRRRKTRRRYGNAPTPRGRSTAYRYQRSSTRAPAESTKAPQAADPLGIGESIVPSLSPTVDATSLSPTVAATSAPTLSEGKGEGGKGAKKSKGKGAKGCKSSKQGKSGKSGKGSKGSKSKGKGNACTTTPTASPTLLPTDPANKSTTSPKKSTTSPVVSPAPSSEASPRPSLVIPLMALDSDSDSDSDSEEATVSTRKSGKAPKTSKKSKGGSDQSGSTVTTKSSKGKKARRRRR